jgi:putative ATP-dependent endonuclease of OLD family
LSRIARQSVLRAAVDVHIDHIEVTNHSRIRDLKLDVRDHAVIVGANDVGKSSLLRLLHLLLGSTTGHLFQQLSPADLVDQSVELIVEVRFVGFNNSDRALFPREISIAPDNKSESLRVQLVVASDPDDSEAVTIRRWFPEGGHERGPSREQLKAFGWRYLPATRGASASSLDGPNSALQGLLKAIDLGAEKMSLTGLLDHFNKQLQGSAPITALRGNVASHLSKAMPRSIAQDDLSVRTAADPEAEVLSNVSMFLARNGEHVPISEQSDGLCQLMPMTLFDLAEGAANVMAIDEPELHLHPSSQRTVAELFGSSKNQKILTTHSPYIVQRFEPSQIVTISPDGVCHQIAADKLSEIEKERAHWWSSRLLEVLTSRYAIIVEGASDRVIVEKVANLMGISLDRIGAVVFDLDGASKFPHVYKLIGKAGFCVPILGLVDDAEKMLWHGQLGGKPRDVFGTCLWVSKPDLEAEYSAAFTGPGAARALIHAGFCKEHAILSSCGVTDLEDVTAERLAAYCRSSKVSAAVAIASQLDIATARKITSVHGLLQKLSELGTA